MPQKKIADNNLTTQERNTLVEENLNLVYKFAYKLCKDASKIDDCIQEGCLGLMRAARLYNPEKHQNKFSSYAAFEIQCFIKDFLWYNKEAVRLPDVERSGIVKYYDTVRRTEINKGELSENEKRAIAEEFNISRDSYHWISQGSSSLNAQCGDFSDGSSSEIGELIAAPQSAETVESQMDCETLLKEMQKFFEESSSYNEEVQTVIKAWMTEFIHNIYNEESKKQLDILREMYPQFVSTESDSVEVKKQKYKELDRINCRMNYVWSKAMKDFREYLVKKDMINNIREAIYCAAR